MISTIIKSLKTFPIIVLIAICSLSICAAEDYGVLKPHERKTAEAECKFLLNRLGSSERAYFERHHSYATWDALQNQFFLKPEKNYGNYIKKYSIALFELGKGRRLSDSSIYASSFTIVATPKSAIYQLRTFGIDSRGKVKEWVGDRTEFWLELVDMGDEELWIDPK